MGPDFFDKLRKRIEEKVVDFEAFASKECWQWGAALKKGKEQYGKVHFMKDGEHFNTSAHRAMFVAANKVMPGDLRLDISHLCHEGLCVNPRHLVHEEHVVNVDRRACTESGVCRGHRFKRKMHKPCMVYPHT